VFPRNALLAARVAYAGGQQAWVPAFVRAVYDANFARDLEINSPDVIAPLLDAVGQDPAALLTRAASAEVKGGLREQTETALRRGIFGAPSFCVGDELFWGNDRLEQALACASRR
jgi:2-hydroxychromene-2-carboxylate isomerase